MDNSITERLQSLQRLRQDGVLSETEFQQLKQKLISDSLKDPAERVEENRIPFFSRTIEVDPRTLGKRYLSLVVVCAAIIAIAVFPLINEGAGNECSSLEASLVRTVGQSSQGPENALAAGLITLFQRASNGALASTAIKKKYPMLPPAMGCMVGYYHALLRPSDWGGDPVTASNAPEPQSSGALPDASNDASPKEASIAPPTNPSPAPLLRHRQSNGPTKTEESTSPPQIEPATPNVVRSTLSDPLRPIMRTHTIPPYPPISIRLNESGTTLMEVHITAEGNVDDCKTVQTSSSDRLDQAACEYVKYRWRWQPPTNGGVPTAVSTRVSVKWDLRDAQGSPP